jgi:hypothetical protein
MAFLTPYQEDLVGLGRLELPTSPLSGVRSNQLSYSPIYRLVESTFINSNYHYSDLYNQVIRCGHLQVLGKEVIQPQVPLGLPCYDFTPVINHTVVSAQF